MTDFTIYNEITGSVQQIGVCSDTVSQLQESLNFPERAVEGHYYSKANYFLLDVPTNRPTQPITLDKTTFIANGVDSVTITGAVTGSTMTIRGDTTTEQSGPCDNPDYFITEIPDTYTLTISNFPYLDFVATLEAT